MNLRGVEPVHGPPGEAGRTEDVTDQLPVDEVCRLRGIFIINLEDWSPSEKYSGKTEVLFDLLA